MNESIGYTLGFDWSENRLPQIIEARNDRICTIWDINQGQIIKEVVAHESEVLGVSISPNPDIFATCGSDGAVHVFDARDFSEAKVQISDERSWISVDWNKKNQNLLALFDAAGVNVTIQDVRKPGISLCEVISHSNSVNGIKWSPNSEYFSHEANY